jgi:hypothetical protein
MGKIGFYNDNANRAYPFVKGTVNMRPPGAPPTIVDTPHSLVVDAGFIMGLDSGFDAGLHDVYLHELRREGSTFFFEFRSDAPGLFNKPLIFTRDVGDPEYMLDFVDNDDEPMSSCSFSPDGSGARDCEPTALWSGFLVTGDIAELEALLPAPDTISRAADTDGIIEPALIQNLADSYVDSLNIANNDRTRVDASEGCNAVTWPHPINIIFCRDLCVRGETRLKPGFNAVIEHNEFDNALEIGATSGAGEGPVCDEVPLFTGESPPVGATNTLFEGGEECNEVVRSINGVGGKFLDLLATTGVSIVPDPENHKIVVDIDMAGLALCFTSADSEVSEQI